MQFTISCIYVSQASTLHSCLGRDSLKTWASISCKASSSFSVPPINPNVITKSIAIVSQWRVRLCSYASKYQVVGIGPNAWINIWTHSFHVFSFHTSIQRAKCLRGSPQPEKSSRGGLTRGSNCRIIIFLHSPQSWKAPLWVSHHHVRVACTAKSRAQNLHSLGTSASNFLRNSLTLPEPSK